MKAGTRRHPLVPFTLVLLAALALDLPSLRAEPRAPVAPGGAVHALRDGFRNLDPAYHYSMLGRARRLFKQTLAGAPARGQAPTILPNDGAALRANGTEPTITWVGHATLLVQLNGLNILTDPHWGERASPVPFAGPRRLVPPGIPFDDLPPIDVVVISHDHYDHLDHDTVVRLARVDHPLFIVPLGIKMWLANQAHVDNAVELDWWQSKTFRGVTFTAAPAQHSSGRTLTDQNKRLWASWVIAGPHHRLFFAGDTGYTPRLAEIGRRYGPFDAAAIPIGGYSAFAEHHPNHVNPEEALQLFEDVRGRLFVPIHWGTFGLNREPFHEPPDRLMKAAVARGLDERIALLSPGQTIHW